MPQRAIGVIIKNNKILLMRRIKNGQEYYVFPGGGVENGENIREATTREIKEELSLDAKLDKLLFQIENQGRQEYYFLIKEFKGIPELGGEEKNRMNKDNQYYPVWIELDKISNLDNLYPEKAKEKIKTEVFLPKDYLSEFKDIFLKNNEKNTEIEITFGNYDDNGKLIKEGVPTITTDFCEIGICKEIIYFVFIIFSDTYRKKIFDLFKDFPDVQFYGFKNFKVTLYPHPNFKYSEFENKIKKEKYLQIQFNYNISKISPELLYKEYIKIRNIFIRNKIKVVDQIKKV